MSTRNVLRLGVVSLVFASLQTAGFDRVLVFGVAYLALPLYVTVTVCSRLPFTNAVLAGAVTGFAWDMLSVDLFGRYALGLAIAGGFASIVLFENRSEVRVRRLGRRALVVAGSTIGLALLSAAVGETLPVFSFATLAGFVVATTVGAVLSGSVLRRIVMPARLVWDPNPGSPSAWTTHRPGLYVVPSSVIEREAA